MMLAGCEPPKPHGGALFSDAPPPVRFQGDNWAIVTFMAGRRLERSCGSGKPAPPLGQHYGGCAYHRFVTLPNPCSPVFAGQSFATFACHELGHVNRWPPTHGE